MSNRDSKRSSGKKRGSLPPPAASSSSAQAASDGADGESASASGSSSRALEQELARVKGEIAKVAGELERVMAAIGAWEDDPEAAFMGLKKGQKRFYKDADKYRTQLETEKADLVRKEELLVRKDADLQAEKTAQAQRDAAQALAKVADVQPRSLWKRLDQPGVRCLEVVSAQRGAKVARSSNSGSVTGTRSSKTKGWAKPSIVVNWSDFTDMIQAPADDIHTTVPFDLSATPNFYANSSEAVVEVWMAYFFSTLLINITGLIRDVTATPQHSLGGGKICDWAFLGPDETAMFPVKVKAPQKCTPADPNDMAQHWAAREATGRPSADYSSITQVFVYSCMMESRYCVLSSGKYTWFMRREEEQELMISDGFLIDGEGPSLAQAWVTFLLLAAADHKKFPAPPHAKVFIDSEKKKKEETDAQRGQAATATRKANKKDKAHNGKGKAKGAAAVDSLPLEELSCALAPTETFGPLNHGVAHRNMLHGIDSVIKIVDADKDVDGTEALEHEASLYKELGDIWGTAIPSMVYAGRLSMGRASLAVTYEGKSLEQAAPAELGIEPEELKRKSLSALDALHQHGVLHGDLALRNIVVNPATKAVKLIDLGSARRSNDKALMAGEVQALATLFDDCDAKL